MSALHAPVPHNGADIQFPECSTEHDRLSARILLSLSYPTHEMGQTSESIRLLVNAEQLASRRSLSQLSVVTRAQHGLLLLREGRAADAIKRLDGAVQLMHDAEPARTSERRRPAKYKRLPLDSLERPSLRKF